MEKQSFLVWLDSIMKKYSLEGGFLHATYRSGIENENLEACYVDDRVKKARQLRKELRLLVNEYLEDHPNAIKPLYS